MDQPMSDAFDSMNSVNTHSRNPSMMSITSTASEDYEANVNFERNPEMYGKAVTDKATAAKFRLEHFYKSQVSECADRLTRLRNLESKLANEMAPPDKMEKELMLLGKKESDFLRLRRKRLGIDDFINIRVIGKGGFGEVRLVQKADSGQIYAMKTLKKSEMVMRDQLAHARAERDLMAEIDTPWVVQLYYSFQDSTYLHLIMEFCPGGDLMTMLLQYDTFSEDITKFYIAECVCAVEAVHSLGFVHRDVKPDNLLIDQFGHLKLSDFGLSTGFYKTHNSAYYQRLMETTGAPFDLDTVKAIDLSFSQKDRIQTWKKNRRAIAYSRVGSPDYVAVETIRQDGYTKEVDWWSVGVIMYECLVGYPPFASQNSPQMTYWKIMNWSEHLNFPEYSMSWAAEDLIRKLICEPKDRIGATEIKNHPFFQGVDWSSLRSIRPPFVPELQSITDTSYFPTEDLMDIPEQISYGPGSVDEIHKDLAFVGYTFKRFDYLSRKNAI